MPTTWDINEVNRHIADKVEEGQNLEYKAADALGASDGKRHEITKDVSAMANAAGGVLIYGVKEYDDEARRHLPECPDWIDRSQFSREWLAQVINNIRPRIADLVIYPLTADHDPSKGIYVVDVPQGTTAHQATDFRYYRRYNFEVLRMYDHEIRDVMNRATRPDATAIFLPSLQTTDNSGNVNYRLITVVQNIGPKKIDDFMLEFIFPGIGASAVYYPVSNPVLDKPSQVHKLEQQGLRVVYRSLHPLLPYDQQNLSQPLTIGYTLNPELRQRFDPSTNNDRVGLEWRLLADDMPPKLGFVPIFPDLDHS